MVIYEWADAPYLGKKDSADEDDLVPVCSHFCSRISLHWNHQQKTYVCTSDALVQGDCTQEDLGHFILDLPLGKTINDTSFWSARVLLSSDSASISSMSTKSLGPLQQRFAPRENPNPSPDNILTYNQAIHYHVTKTGYYCVGMYPNCLLKRCVFKHSSYIAYFL